MPLLKRSRAQGRFGDLITFAIRAQLHLDHSARHEASDLDGITFKLRHRPDHRSTYEIRLGDQGIIWHIDPLAIETDAIMPVLRFPIWIGDGFAICHRTARSPFAGELIEPGV